MPSIYRGHQGPVEMEIIKQNEIKVLLMVNVHGRNLHLACIYIYADTEILSARLLIILSVTRYNQTFH
jgi:hypothetical protein